MTTVLYLYLAAGLFNAGERLHTLYLEKHLLPLGYKIKLPLREAKPFATGDHFDGEAIVAQCTASSKKPEYLHVGCVDGASSDPGQAVEFGFAVGATGRAVVYRTDFRTDLKREVGINAMFRQIGVPIIYEPCFFTELSEVDAYYAKLAQKIHEAIQEVVNRG